jgi:hypothetical protein
MGARKLRVVTPSATDPLPEGVCDTLLICDTGVVAISIIAEDDTAPVTISVTGPIELRVRAKAVRVTGTTATNIVATY